MKMLNWIGTRILVTHGEEHNITFGATIVFDGEFNLTIHFYKWYVWVCIC